MRLMILEGGRDQILKKYLASVFGVCCSHARVLCAGVNGKRPLVDGQGGTENCQLLPPGLLWEEIPLRTVTVYALGQKGPHELLETLIEAEGKSHSCPYSTL